jgi:hypothetical protein
MFAFIAATLRLTSAAVTPPRASSPHARYIDARGLHVMSWWSRPITS